MLSVLIPTYNYSAWPLVSEIHKQCEIAEIYYEIIVLDDGSTDATTLIENEKINSLSHCRFIMNTLNSGRAKTLNSLAEKSQYKWLLFMDCDTFPKNDSFIINYLEILQNSLVKVCFGGIAYQKQKPDEKSILRWKYGSKREEIAIEKRLKNPFTTTLTSNILIDKDIFNLIHFDERIAEYGYEDLVFIQHLKTSKINIIHIENATYHLNYETSKEFLNKTQKALQTLKYIEETRILNGIETKIQKTYRLVSVLKMNHLLSFLFVKLKKKSEKNLLSANPSLFLFDLYKLGYFCFIKT